VDASEKFGSGDQQALELIKQHMDEQPDRGRVFLLLNKIDIIPKQHLLPLIEEWNRRYEFQEIIPISAKTGAGLDVLLDKIILALPQGPRYFPEDQVTDQPERFLAAEIIREQILRKTGKEVPYSIAVMVERYEEVEKLIRIAATIYCEREGQKGIIIGKRGEHLKEMGTAARLELERLLGKKVFLELHVKVKPGWRESQAFLEDLDWRTS